MSMFTEIMMAIQEIAERHGETTDDADALPQTFDELRASTPTIKSEFAKVLEAEAAKKRGEQ